MSTKRLYLETTSRKQHSFGLPPPLQIPFLRPCQVGVCEFTGLECENGVLEWNTGVEYWSIQTEFLDANIANQDTHQV